MTTVATEATDPGLGDTLGKVGLTLFRPLLELQTCPGCHEEAPLGYTMSLLSVNTKPSPTCFPCKPGPTAGAGGADQLSLVSGPYPRYRLSPTRTARSIWLGKYRHHSGHQRPFRVSPCLGTHALEMCTWVAESGHLLFWSDSTGRCQGGTSRCQGGTSTSCPRGRNFTCEEQRGRCNELLQLY